MNFLLTVSFVLRFVCMAARHRQLKPLPCKLMRYDLSVMSSALHWAFAGSQMRIGGCFCWQPSVLRVMLISPALQVR
jgi:hypothetical protein